LLLQFSEYHAQQRKTPSALSLSIQPPRFAEAACLVRMHPALNEWRSDRMEVCADLFGRALPVRHRARIGTHAHRRLDPQPDPGAATTALAALRRRGDQDRP